MLARRFAVVGLLMTCLIGFAPLCSSAQEPEQAPPPAGDEGDRVAVIPAGQEEIIGQMLGHSVALPGGCKLTDGKIDKGAIVATYECNGAPVVFELVHPDVAPSGSSKTANFALTVKSGTPPDALTADLVARIRAHEAKFQWKWLGAERHASPMRPIVIGGALLIVIGAVILMLRRRAA